MLTKNHFSLFFFFFCLWIIRIHFLFQINLTQRPVLHLYNDLICEAFHNIGGGRTNIERELERYSKYSRNKTMFDYWPEECYIPVYCYNVINCSSVATVDFQNSSVWTVTINLVGVHLSFLVHQNYGMKHCSLSAFLLSIAKFRMYTYNVYFIYLRQNKVTVLLNVIQEYLSFWFLNTKWQRRNKW